MNEFVRETDPEIPLLRIDPASERRHLERLRGVRSERDGQRAEACLRRLSEACAGNENTMPYLIEAAHAYCTLGEVCNVMRESFGEYRPATVA